jgi:prephenate dehydratase
MAARALFGHDIVAINTRRFREIFEEVSSGHADFGVVPLENALAGSVHENFDLLASFDCPIVAEYYCPVELHLMVKRKHGGCIASLADLKTVASHAKALEQCSQFIERHTQLGQLVQSDTAGAAQLVAQSDDLSLAAIASEEAAQVFDLEIIERSIQNHATNMTRFVAISKTNTPLAPANKGSVMFTLLHQPGSLYQLLGVLADTGLNLTKIESRPILGMPFEYTFYADIEQSSNARGNLSETIQKLRPFTVDLRVLGTYAAQSWGERAE